MNIVQKIALFIEPMTVVGNDSIGWKARYSGDPNASWAACRETAIFACTQRRDEVLAGTLIRNSLCFYSA